MGTVPISFHGLNGIPADLEDPCLCGEPGHSTPEHHVFERPTRVTQDQESATSIAGFLEKGEFLGLTPVFELLGEGEGEPGRPQQGGVVSERRTLDLKFGREGGEDNRLSLANGRP
jgi:hypothetical protein